MGLGTVAQWVGAFLTFAAIAVALFKEYLLRRFWHPDLALRLEPVHPDCVKTPATHGAWQGSRYFLRFWVKNEGKVRADKVEVFVSEAFVERGADSFVKVPRFTPMNLRWSYSEHLRPTIYTDGISPQMGRYCDFGAISDPMQPDMRSLAGPGKTRLALQFEFLQPAAEWLLPGKYRFTILLAASNCKPVARSIELHLTGMWSEDEADMFANGFVLRADA